MKSTLATSPRPTTQPAAFRLTASGTFVERMRQISAAIANRAYELFEARGSEHGHDWEDWFRAESELLTPIPAQVVDMDGRFTVRAQVPGFTDRDVEVRADPRRLIIYAKKKETSQQETGKPVHQRKISDEIFRVLDLPGEIDPDNITATVKDEVLEVTLPKVNPGKKMTADLKAA
jgi:HSP20 family molecular chaperone IbpA